MVVRHDLINSALTFLQDPSVASAPIEKKIAFLRSKNLSQEEIDTALGSLAKSNASGVPIESNNGFSSREPIGVNRYPTQLPYGFGSPGYWQQPGPGTARRDWRDWFIMATVLGGIGYGIILAAKSYIMPLIQPPTPPQLQQDKEEIDAEFAKTFALLDQLTADTAALKAAEEDRTERLDSTLSELKTVIDSMKESDRRQGDEARRNADDIRSLHELLPRALEANKEIADAKLRELALELKSLKTMVSNRMGNSNVPQLQQHSLNYQAAVAGVSQSTPNRSMLASEGTNGAGMKTTGAGPSSTLTIESSSSTSASTSPTSTPSSSTLSAVNANRESMTKPVTSSSLPTFASGGAPSQSVAGFPYTRFTETGKASIPAWQLAESQKANSANASQTKPSNELKDGTNSTNT